MITGSIIQLLIVIFLDITYILLKNVVQEVVDLEVEVVEVEEKLVIIQVRVIVKQDQDALIMVEDVY